ncbi:MAG: hypothetical protein RJB66_383 [Pseudomonadota bacterium]|jgi:uncharacterized protein YndB with AHSA1/START domain
MVNFDEAKSKRQMPVADPKLDLIFERTSNLSVEQVWKGWTDPETLMKWFCPRPWKVTSCRTDLRAGGEFHTIMEGPNGERNIGDGCYLEVVPYKKLVWTNMMSKDYRPNPADVMGFPFVVTVEFESAPQGSIYRATVQHSDSEGRSTHEKMGFQEGWGMAFNQLIEHYSSVK